jgi:hypothetical protein
VAGGTHNITAITRSGSSATFLENVRRQPVDYNSHESLVNALRGQQALILTMSTSAPQDTQQKLIFAAKEAGVQWILPSEYGTDHTNRPDVGSETRLGPPALAIRQAIIEAGLNFVSISCGMWYEYAFGDPTRFGLDLKKREITLYGEGSIQITTSTWAQCGRAVAALLSLPVESAGTQQDETTLSQFRNKSAYIGSFYVSQKDIFASVIRSSGTSEADWTVQNEPVEERYQHGNKMLAGGDRWGFSVALYARLFYADGACDLQVKLANDALGLPKEDLDGATKEALGMVERGDFELK